MISWKKLARLAALGIILSACSVKTPASTLQPSVIPVTTEQPAAATEIAAPEVVETDYCVSCHLDKDELIRTAKPVVETETESEGAG